LEKAGTILNHLLNNLLEKKQNKDGTIYYRFFSKWEHIIGKKLYGHTKIIDLKNNNLIIVVDHPGWLQILKMNERTIIKKVRKLFPQLAVKSMKVSVREDYFKMKDHKKQPGFNSVDESIRGKREKEKKSDISVENSVEFSKIKDEQLKDTLKRLYMSVIKKSEES
jgi:hypothetical protein